ncbi:hypothetical protein L6R52_18595 [Myxococcota bacterium]|nr:hypothetical protein [Myxococcota bacterium]
MNTTRTSTNLNLASTKLLRIAALALGLGFVASTAEARTPDVIGDQTAQASRATKKESAAKPLPVRPTKLTYARQTLPLVPAGTPVDYEETIVITGERLAKVDYEETIVITGKRLPKQAPAKVDYEETIVITGKRLPKQAPAKVDYEETIIITGNRLPKQTSADVDYEETIVVTGTRLPKHAGVTH